MSGRADQLLFVEIKNLYE